MIGAPEVVAPHSFDLERAVLGATLHSPAALRDLLAEAAVGELFYMERHRAVVVALGDVAPSLNGALPDRALVRAAAATRGDDLDDALLLEIYEAGFLVTDVRAYLVQLRELAARREEHAAAMMLAAATRDGALEAPALWAAVRQRLTTAEAWRARSADPARAAAPAYLESITTFLAEDEPPHSEIFPDLLPAGVLLLLHGEPRTRKSLAAFELALAAATGTAPFGLARFRPAAALPVLYIQEEDPRALTKARLRRLVSERCGATAPATLHVSVRRGVDLDDPAWVEQIIHDCTRLGVRLLVLDAARRLSAKTDEGPAKVRELMAALRTIVTRAGVAIVIVHHDIKPPLTGQDVRRRGQRASGGDWFAGCECPVHVERLNDRESLVFPEDYKFAADPAPFTFTCLPDGRLIRCLVGRDTTTDHAKTAGARGAVLEWLRLNGPASKTAMKQAGFRWDTIVALLDGLIRDGLVDEAPGRKRGSHLYFVIGQPSPDSRDGSPIRPDDAT